MTGSVSLRYQLFEACAGSREREIAHNFNLFSACDCYLFSGSLGFFFSSCAQVFQFKLFAAINFTYEERRQAISAARIFFLVSLN